jgi:hypothetical protein
VPLAWQYLSRSCGDRTIGSKQRSLRFQQKQYGAFWISFIVPGSSESNLSLQIYLLGYNLSSRAVFNPCILDMFSLNIL